MGSQKIAKLNRLTAMLEGRSNVVQKRSLDIAKARLRLRDPGVDITKTLNGLNNGDTKEALAYFLCDNFLTPLIIKFISKKEPS